MYRYETEPPLLVVIDTSGGDQVFESHRTLRGIDIMEPGDVHVTDVRGVEVTATFPAVADGGTYPYRWIAQIKTIHDDGTVPDASLIGLE